jgi:hypothetical protein
MPNPESCELRQERSAHSAMTSIPAGCRSCAGADALPRLNDEFVQRLKAPIYLTEELT